MRTIASNVLIRLLECPCSKDNLLSETDGAKRLHDTAYRRDKTVIVPWKGRGSIAELKLKPKHYFFASLNECTQPGFICPIHILVFVIRNLYNPLMENGVDLSCLICKKINVTDGRIRWCKLEYILIQMIANLNQRLYGKYRGVPHEKHFFFKPQV